MKTTDNRGRPVVFVRLLPFRPLVAALLFFLVLAVSGGGEGADDPMARLRDETLSFFKPLKGAVLSVQNQRITSDLSVVSGVKPGMRFTILRQGEPFLHPVTKEKIGMTEAMIGNAVVKEAGPAGSVLELDGGKPKPGDILRISDVRIRILFFQDKGLDWSVGEHYYRLLKESGRVDFIDTALDSGDDASVLADAKKREAAVALLLRPVDDAGKNAVFTQSLYWVGDGSKFSETRVTVDQAVLKELHFGEGMLSPMAAAGDALYFFDLPFRGRSVGAGDVNGDGKPELIIASGRDIMVYEPGASLRNLFSYTGQSSDDFIWVDAFDVNGDGKEEIVATSLRGDEIASVILAARGGEIVPLWKGAVFLRRMGGKLIAQAYERGQGFSGPVYSAQLVGSELKKDADLKLPAGMGIYDFSLLKGLDNATYVLGYGESGSLSLYAEGGLRVWGGKDELSGFQTTVKKDAPTIMVDRGSWTVRDRLLARSSEAFVVKRVPLAEVARGLGYKSSQIKALIWNGLSMDERVLIEGISGSVVDYTVAGDWLVVLSRPLFGVKAGKLLKGQNPLGTMLYVYSLKGK